MKHERTLYTVSRCRNDNTFYGPCHGSDDGKETTCGKLIDHQWFIVTNAFDGLVTCKKCLSRIKSRR